MKGGACVGVIQSKHKHKILEDSEDMVKDRKGKKGIKKGLSSTFHNSQSPFLDYVPSMVNMIPIWLMWFYIYFQDEQIVTDSGSKKYHTK